MRLTVPYSRRHDICSLRYLYLLVTQSGKRALNINPPIASNLHQACVSLSHVCFTVSGYWGTWPLESSSNVHPKPDATR